MKKVCIHLAKGFEEIEAIAPIDILRRAGIEVQIISVTGRLEVEGARNITVLCNEIFENVDYSGVDMILLPGGMPGTKNLDGHAGLKSQIMEFNKQGKWIAAICAAPMILGKLGILQGHKAICYPGFEKDLIGAEIVSERVVVSGNIVTGIGAGEACNFGLKLVEILKNKTESDKLKTTMFI